MKEETIIKALLKLTKRLEKLELDIERLKDGLEEDVIKMMTRIMEDIK